MLCRHLNTGEYDDISANVKGFFTEFEMIMTAISASKAQQLLFLRHSLRSLARVFVRSIETATACSYDSLKGALMNEFRYNRTAEEVYSLLRNRRWDRQREPLQLYVVELLNFAKNADIPEKEIVGIIVDNLSKDNPDVWCYLGAASTAVELKYLIRLHKHRLISETVTEDVFFFFYIFKLNT